MVFGFGPYASKTERIEIDVLGYERREPIGEYHDDNWLRIIISACVGGFTANIWASVMTYELKQFLKQLHILYETLQGEARFNTLENQLSLMLEGNGRGHIKLTGKILDRACDENHLKFRLNFDQTDLYGAIQDLERTVQEFPVRSEGNSLH